MRTRIPAGGVTRKLRMWISGIFLGVSAATASAGDPVFASPLPPGPGQVPMVSGPLVAPILMPLAAPTAAPVGVYHYGSTPVVMSGEASAPQSADPARSFDVASPSRTHRLWVAADFFYGVTQGSWVPPLVTSSPPVTPPGQAGVLGAPTTTVEFGGTRSGNEFRPGLRLEVGWWCDDSRTNGIEASYFFLGTCTSYIDAAQPHPAAPPLFQPVVLGTTNAAVPLGLSPAGVAGHVSTETTGADVNYRRNLRDCSGSRIDLLAGYRFLYLTDEAALTTSRFPAGVGVVSDSLFRTYDQFHGGQIGIAACHGFASGTTIEFAAKCALGVTLRTAEQSGTTTTGGGTVPASLLTGPNNSGRFTDQDFAVVPEALIRVGHRFGDRVRVNAGYSFLYWSKVQRAADQIDLTQSTTRPAYTAATTDFWIQGWTLGFEVRY